MLVRMLSKEFIFKPDSEERDFADSLNYLLHTNVLSRLGEDRYELVKLNLRQFFVHLKLFEYVLEDYAEIYGLLMGQG